MIFEKGVDTQFVPNAAFGKLAQKPARHIATFPSLSSKLGSYRDYRCSRIDNRYLAVGAFWWSFILAGRGITPPENTQLNYTICTDAVH